MTKREFLIKWKVDIKLHYVGKSNLVLKHEWNEVAYDEEKFDFVKNDIDNYIELLNDYKNIEWNNNEFPKDEIIIKWDKETDYCLQGADFFANSIHKNYNKNDNKFYIYLRNRKKIKFKLLPYNINSQ